MNLINFLKENKYTRKVFGERELKIIEKQLLGINLTQSEKNRLSRDIRKKFEFIKEVIRFSKDFELKKGSIIKEYIEEAKEFILNDILYKKIKRIILYGSVVGNKLSFKSDIDLAVEFYDISLNEATMFRKRISGKVNQKVDIQVYNYLPNKVKMEIQSRGKILYEN